MTGWCASEGSETDTPDTYLPAFECTTGSYRFFVNHTSTHVAWNLCRHGNLRTKSSSSKLHK